MNKQEEYKNHSRSISGIYHNLGVQLDGVDMKWLDDIFSITAIIDDLIDAGNEGTGKIVLELLESGRTLNTSSFPYIGEILALRNHLLSLEDGEDRLNIFLRTLRILFRQTKKISQTEEISVYLKSSILEGRAFGRMVALGVKDLHYANIIRQAGGMENLTDDLLDLDKDFFSGERKMKPSIGIYMKGVGLTVSEILNMKNKFGLIKSFHAIRASVRAMWKKYILEQISF